MYLVDLPGYGYARGGDDAAKELAAVAAGYFASRGSRVAGRDSNREARSANRGATLLLVDSRHPGLDLDRQAHAWLSAAAGTPHIVATKIDKLSRAERARSLKEMERVFGNAPLPVSAAGGEGLDELWKLIARIARTTAK
jgi:GTP-binding protein